MPLIPKQQAPYYTTTNEYNSKTLTDAQIKALPTTGVELIPTPGQGKMIFLNWAVLLLNNYVNDYTNIDPTATIQIVGLEAFAGTLVNVPQATNTSVANILAAGDNTLSWLTIYQGITTGLMYPATGSLPADFNNRNIGIRMTNGALGNLTGGDTTTTLKIILDYKIINL